MPITLKVRLGACGGSSWPISGLASLSFHPDCSRTQWHLTNQCHLLTTTLEQRLRPCHMPAWGRTGQTPQMHCRSCADNAAMPHHMVRTTHNWKRRTSSSGESGARARESEQLRCWQTANPPQTPASLSLLPPAPPRPLTHTHQSHFYCLHLTLSAGLTARSPCQTLLLLVGGCARTWLAHRLLPQSAHTRKHHSAKVIQEPDPRKPTPWHDRLPGIGNRDHQRFCARLVGPARHPSRRPARGDQRFDA